MDTSTASADVVDSVPPCDETRLAAVLRGTARGLEIVVDAAAANDAICDAVVKRLDEAPGFFRGSDVRIRVEDGPLAAGCLSRLDEIAVAFELRIVEVPAQKRAKTATGDADAVPTPNLAAGSAPSPAFEDEAPTNAGAKLVSLPPVLPEIVEAAPLTDADLDALLDDAPATPEVATGS